MSYSLQVRSGDLNPSGGAVATVSGVQKLVQDLRCAPTRTARHRSTAPRLRVASQWRRRRDRTHTTRSYRLHNQ